MDLLVWLTTNFNDWPAFILGSKVISPILEATMKAFAILLMITVKTVLGAPINPDGNQLSYFLISNIN